MIGNNENLNPEAENDSNLPLDQGDQKRKLLAADTDVKNTPKIFKVTKRSKLDKGEKLKKDLSLLKTKKQKWDIAKQTSKIPVLSKNDSCLISMKFDQK